MLTGHTSDLFNFHPGYRLLVCHNGQRFQQYIGQYLLSRLFCNPDQIFILRRLCTNLISTVQFQDLQTTVVCLIPVCQITQDHLCLPLIYLECKCQFFYFHRITHRKQNGLCGSFIFFYFHFLITPVSFL